MWSSIKTIQNGASENQIGTRRLLSLKHVLEVEIKGLAVPHIYFVTHSKTDRETYWYTQKFQKTPPLRGALWANKTKTIRIRSNTVPDPPLLMSLPTWPVWCPLLLLPESSSHTNGPFKTRWKSQKHFLSTPAFVKSGDGAAESESRTELGNKLNVGFLFARTVNVNFKWTAINFTNDSKILQRYV